MAYRPPVLRLMKSGSWFAIETLMSVAAIGALFIGATAEAAMVLMLFLIGERLEGWAASRARRQRIDGAETGHRHPPAQR